MQYSSFPELITAKFGIVLEKWPLPKFVPPGSINSATTIRLLFNAFERDITFFRALSDAEWEAWVTAHEAGEAPPSVTIAALAAPLVGGTTSEAPEEPAVRDGAATDANSMTGALPGPMEVDTSPAPQDSAPASNGGANPGENPTGQVAAAPVMAFQFVNASAPDEGSAFQVKKRARKTRSDKGKPRKRRAAADETGTPAAME